MALIYLFLYKVHNVFFFFLKSNPSSPSFLPPFPILLSLKVGKEFRAAALRLVAEY